MKIMFNTMSLGKGGAERVINILSNSFIKENGVMIVTNITSGVEYEFDDKVIIKSLVKKSNTLLRKIRRVSPFVLLRLKRIITNYKPDIIVSFLPEPSFRVLLLKKHFKSIKNIPVIVSIRNDPNIEYSNKFFNILMKRLYPFANQLVLQTNDAKQYFIKNINFNGIVIPNPVSDSFLTKRYDGKREKRIVAVGRLEPQKNYKNMIDSFEIVSKKYNDYVFNIYGDGNLRSELQKYIDEKKMSDKIILVGQIDNIKDAIYKAKVFVMSSDYEGMPNSLLEASCLGIPCVSTDCPCGGPREILDNGNSGSLVSVNNSKELAEEICKIIHDDNYANRISENANNNNTFKYDKDRIIKQWNETINQVIKGLEK